MDNTENGSYNIKKIENSRAKKKEAIEARNNLTEKKKIIYPDFKKIFICIFVI